MTKSAIYLTATKATAGAVATASVAEWAATTAATASPAATLETAAAILGKAAMAVTITKYAYAGIKNLRRYKSPEEQKLEQLMQHRSKWNSLSDRLKEANINKNKA